MDNEHERETTCCFSGYRPQKLPWGSNERDERCRRLRLRLYNIVSALYDAGIRRFICGMALGCDTYFCEAVVKLREERWDVTLEAAIPGGSQSERWNADAQRRYDRLISQCDRQTVISEGDMNESLLARNRYMVDSSAVLVCVYDGQPGGTLYTLRYARRMGLEIIELPPVIE
ncbi:MAG: DUF1273 family protein [Oscillospiraceae bacterium]|nr:DUF1273 family protein [Oscillospiraceae bacterium]